MGDRSCEFINYGIVQYSLTESFVYNLFTNKHMFAYMVKGCGKAPFYIVYIIYSIYLYSNEDTYFDYPVAMPMMTSRPRIETTMT